MSFHSVRLWLAQFDPFETFEYGFTLPDSVIGKLALSVAARVHKSQETGTAVRNHINLEHRNYSTPIKHIVRVLVVIRKLMVTAPITKRMAPDDT